MSTKWDQARQEVRLEDHDILREKIILQQELIRRQDEYAEQIRVQEATDEAQVGVTAKKLRPNVLIIIPLSSPLFHYQCFIFWQD